MNKKIAIIGGGNLGSAIVRGLLYTKAVRPELIHVTRRKVNLLAPLAELGVRVGDHNIAAVKDAHIILLAVKPYQIAEVCAELSAHFADGAIVVSLAAGVDHKKLLQICGGNHAIFRAMPNTAIAIGESMTCLSGVNHTPQQAQEIEAFFGKIGSVLFMAEELMAAATVLASCGTAFALRYIRAATLGGVEIGVNAELAQKIAAQTVKGAAQLIIAGGTHPEAEIDKVTTPRGITIAGLNEMEHQGFSSSLIKGLLASFNKIESTNK